MSLPNLDAKFKSADKNNSVEEKGKERDGALLVAALDKDRSRKIGGKEADEDMSEVKGREWNLYECKYCKDTFRWPTKLQEHLLNHKGEKKGTDDSDAKSG